MKVAFITGASSGIGQALANLLAPKGFKLILTGKDPNRLRQVAKATNAHAALTADFKLKEDREKIKEAIQMHLPDLFVNNAGFGLYGDALSLPLETQIEMIEVNAAAILEFTLFTAHHFRNLKKHGIILNISSVAGEMPTPGMSVYGATKAFVTNVSEALNFECKKFGIHVLVACPGTVNTSFATRALHGKAIKKQSGPILSAEAVAQQLWRQIVKRKTKLTINWYYRWVTGLGKLFPKRLVMKLIYENRKKL